MGARIYAIALTLEGILDLSSAQYAWVLIGLGTFATAYTVVGGLRAVVWTDVLQAVTLGRAAIAVLVLAVSLIDGGWSGLLRVGEEHGRFTVVHLEPDLLTAKTSRSVWGTTPRRSRRSRRSSTSRA